MGLTPQERQIFDQITSTLDDNEISSTIKRVRLTAVLYTCGAVASIFTIIVPLALNQPWMAIPIFSIAVVCFLRAIPAWQKVLSWDRDEISRRGTVRRFLGL
jgi:predicted ABC-type exoprotein transport system permease subunit